MFDFTLADCESKSGSIRVRVLLAAFAFFVCISAGMSVHTQDTEFVYQGQLQNSSLPANGSFDFEFRLFDAVSGGSQIGSTLVRTATVANGIFSVPLDFASVFPGAPRFLEIKVRQTGGGSYTLLTPRQAINSAPYSIKSETADNATNADTAINATQLGGVAANQYVQTGDARLSDARNPLPNSPSYIQNSTSQQATSNFDVSGTGTAGIFNAATQFNIGGNRVLSNSGTSNIFAGAGSGQSNSTGHENSFFGNAAGFSNVVGDHNAYFGYAAGISHTGVRNSIFGANAGGAVSSGNLNAFFGYQAGFASGGTANAFFGGHAGETNSSGSFNTAVGEGADVGSGDLSYATAIGAEVIVTTSNTVAIGRSIDTVKMPAFVSLTATASGNAAGFGNPNGETGMTISGVSGRADLRFNGILKLVNGPGGIPPETNGIAITTAGNVGIGTISPDQKFSVNGNASKSGGGSWLTFSDERLKNIEGHFTPGLAAVMRLQPILYRYKKENALGIRSEGEHVGFSAQAVEQIIPEAVTKNDQGYRLVNNDPIMWAMLNAVKEQQVQIEMQQRQIDKQNAINKSQQEQLSALKAFVCLHNRNAVVCKAKN